MAGRKAKSTGASDKAKERKFEQHAKKAKAIPRSRAQLQETTKKNPKRIKKDIIAAVDSKDAAHVRIIDPDAERMILDVDRPDTSAYKDHRTSQKKPETEEEKKKKEKAKRQREFNINMHHLVCEAINHLVVRIEDEELKSGMKTSLDIRHTATKQMGDYFNTRTKAINPWNVFQSQRASDQIDDAVEASEELSKNLKNASSRTEHGTVLGASRTVEARKWQHVTKEEREKLKEAGPIRSVVTMIQQQEAADLQEQTEETRKTRAEQREETSQRHTRDGKIIEAVITGLNKAMGNVKGKNMSAITFISDNREVAKRKPDGTHDLSTVIITDDKSREWQEKLEKVNNSKHGFRSFCHGSLKEVTIRNADVLINAELAGINTKNTTLPMDPDDLSEGSDDDQSDDKKMKDLFGKNPTTKIMRKLLKLQVKQEWKKYMAFDKNRLPDVKRWDTMLAAKAVEIFSKHTTLRPEDLQKYCWRKGFSLAEAQELSEALKCKDIGFRKIGSDEIKLTRKRKRNVVEDDDTAESNNEGGAGSPMEKRFRDSSTESDEHEDESENEDKHETIYDDKDENEDDVAESNIATFKNESLPVEVDKNVIEWGWIDEHEEPTEGPVHLLRNLAQCKTAKDVVALLWRLRPGKEELPETPKEWKFISPGNDSQKLFSVNSSDEETAELLKWIRQVVESHKEEEPQLSILH